MQGVYICYMTIEFWCVNKIVQKHDPLGNYSFFFPPCTKPLISKITSGGFSFAQLLYPLAWKPSALNCS